MNLRLENTFFPPVVMMITLQTFFFLHRQDNGSNAVKFFTRYETTMFFLFLQRGKAMMHISFASFKTLFNSFNAQNKQ
jgi:hypothetical protein